MYSAGKTRNFWFKLPTPARQGSNSPSPGLRRRSNAPGFLGEEGGDVETSNWLMSRQVYLIRHFAKKERETKYKPLKIYLLWNFNNLLLALLGNLGRFYRKTTLYWHEIKPAAHIYKITHCFFVLFHSLPRPWTILRRALRWKWSYL